MTPPGQQRPRTPQAQAVAARGLDPSTWKQTCRVQAREGSTKGNKVRGTPEGEKLKISKAPKEDTPR